MTGDPEQDREQLGLLAVFHYILGIVGVIFACLPLIHFSVGIALLSGQLPEAADAPDDGFAIFGGLLFAVVGGTMFVFGQLTAWATIYSGRLMQRRRGRMFSIVVAAVLCTFAPLGTVLGVFTLLVLHRDSVKELYEEAEYYG